MRLKERHKEYMLKMGAFKEMWDVLWLLTLGELLHVLLLYKEKKKVWDIDALMAEHFSF